MSGTNDEPDCGCYADSRTKKACPPIRNVTHPLRYYEFTQEEMKALEECDRESFYRRCLPFSTLLATITYAAIKSGDYIGCVRKHTAVSQANVRTGASGTLSKMSFLPETLQRNPHFGVWPKVTVAVFVGYCFGRLSYLSQCDKKLRKLPENSHLGNVMRKYYADNLACNNPKQKEQ